ncbi:MAG: DMT family transporter [Chloroflexota bacterium]
MRLKADLVLLLVAVLWGSAFAAQRAAGLLGSVYFFNAARFLVAGLILLPFAARSRIMRAQVWWTCAAGVVLFIASALQQAGLQTTTAGNAGFLTSLYVVIVPFVMLVGWKERPRAVSIVAVFLAAVGAYLLSTGGRFLVHAGDLLQLGGAVFWAVHVVLLGKFASRYSAMSFSAGQLLVGSALNWAASSVLEPTAFPLPPILVTSILYTALVSLGLGYTLQIWGQKHTPPTHAAIILSLESVFAALAGALILGEQLAPLQIVGCVIIVLAVLLSQAKGWSRINAPKPPRRSSEADGEHRPSGPEVE